MSAISRFKIFYKKYEHFLSPAALIFGFIGDVLTLNRIDLWYENFVIISYLLLAGAVILIIEKKETFASQGVLWAKITVFAPLALQLSFGALLSAFIVLYSKSADFVASWPFVLILAVLFLGNEFFRKPFVRLAFRLCIYFIAIFSYAICILPVLFHKMGGAMFIASGIASLVLIFIYISLFFSKNRKLLMLNIAVVYIIFNILYFTNIIPPLPLTLKEIGLYHQVERNAGGKYKLTFEPIKWWEYIIKTEPVFHQIAGEPVYIFANIFSPAKLNVKIIHRWSYFNEQQKKWIEVNNLQYPIFGGNNWGYRGYSFKQNIMPGRWRVEVITQNGQVLGRINFKVEKSASAPELKTKLE